MTFRYLVVLIYTSVPQIMATQIQHLPSELIMCVIKMCPVMDWMQVYRVCRSWYFLVSCIALDELDQELTYQKRPVLAGFERSFISASPAKVIRKYCQTFLITHFGSFSIIKEKGHKISPQIMFSIWKKLSCIPVKIHIDYVSSFFVDLAKQFGVGYRYTICTFYFKTQQFKITLKHGYFLKQIYGYGIYLRARTSDFESMVNWWQEKLYRASYKLSDNTSCWISIMPLIETLLFFQKVRHQRIDALKAFRSVSSSSYQRRQSRLRRKFVEEIEQKAREI